MEKTQTKTILTTQFLKQCILWITLLLLNKTQTLAQTMTLSGTNWNVNPPSITEAGEDYAGTYESVADQLLLGVQVPLLLASGKVSVRYEPSPNWHNNLKLAIRRTSEGSTICLLCSLTGGETYQPITTIDTDFLKIFAVLSLANYTNIPIQLGLSGVSVTVPAANYQSRVIFTIGPN